jgi:hypothetical protein
MLSKEFEKELLYTLGDNVNEYNHSGKHNECFRKRKNRLAILYKTLNSFFKLPLGYGIEILSSVTPETN